MDISLLLLVCTCYDVWLVVVEMFLEAVLTTTILSLAFALSRVGEEWCPSR